MYSSYTRHIRGIYAAYTRHIRVIYARGDKNKKIVTKKYKNIRISKNQIVVPSENVVFGISKELGLKSDSQIFLE